MERVSVIFASNCIIDTEYIRQVSGSVGGNYIEASDDLGSLTRR